MKKCVELVMEGLGKLPARSVGQKGRLGDPIGSNPVKETTEVSTIWEPQTNSFFFLEMSFPMNEHIYLPGQI